MRLETEDAVSHIIVVRHLHFVKENDIFEFGGVADDRALPDNGISADECAVADLCLLVDDARSVDACCRRYLCRFCDPDIFAAFLELIFRKRTAKLHDICTDPGQQFPRVDCPVKERCGDRLL